RPFYIDSIVFILAYAIVSCVYRFALKASQRKQFENVMLYVFNFQQMIPILFILDFNNSIRWHESSREGRALAIGRTCVRYMNASLINGASRLHVTVKYRFPTVQHPVQAGKFHRAIVLF
ncbi:Bestrophin-1, partial [Taenia solium]